MLGKNGPCVNLAADEQIETMRWNKSERRGEPTKRRTIRAFYSSGGTIRLLSCDASMLALKTEFVSLLTNHLNDRVRGGERDTAFVLSTDHTDITFLTPGFTPRVLNFPVVGSTGTAITDGQDTVVEVGTTGRVR